MTSAFRRRARRCSGLFALVLVHGLLMQDARADDIERIEEKLKSPETAACAADSDCAVLAGACGDWLTVNTSIAADARTYYAHMATLVECAASPVSSKAPDPSCQAGRCTLPAVLLPGEESEPAASGGDIPDQAIEE